jgi:hypothetical protein
MAFESTARVTPIAGVRGSTRWVAVRAVPAFADGVDTERG